VRTVTIVYTSLLDYFTGYHAKDELDIPSGLSGLEEHPALRDLRTVLLEANEAISLQDKYQ
jgi:hypothetical protein